MNKVCLLNSDEFIEGQVIEGIEIVSMDKKTYMQQSENFEGIIICETEDLSETSKLVLDIRKITDRYIWIILRNDSDINGVIYLRLGCDAILRKGIVQEELVLYIKKVFIRENSLSVDAHDEKNFYLIKKNNSVYIKNYGEIILTRLEYEIVSLLYRNKGNTVTYEEIATAIWPNSNAVRYKASNIIFHLRKKLNNKFIVTVRQKGYLFREEP